MWMVMKFYHIVIGQITAGNRKELCLFLLKLVFICIIFNELYNDFRYLACLIRTGNSLWPFCIIGRIFLITLLVLLYYGIRRLKKRFSPGYAVAGVIIFCLMTSWINGSLFGFFFWDGPYWGRVTDADTGEPVAGASVVGKWKFEGYFFFIGAEGYADVRETVTDSGGRFFLFPARTLSAWPLARIRLEEIIVFKPGYDSNPPFMCYAWNEEEREKWRLKLEDRLRKYHDSLPSDRESIVKSAIEKGNIGYSYRMFFGKFRKDCKIYKPTLIRLNKAESLEEQRTASRISLGNIPFCEGCIKVPDILDLLSRQRRRSYK